MQDTSLLMSDELLGQLDIEDDEKQLLQTRSNIVVIKVKNDKQNDIILGQLRACGLDNETHIFNLELGVKQASILELFGSYMQKKLSIHAIDVHQGENVLSLFIEQEEPYSCIKCNLFDISIESEECTLMISLTK